MVQHPPPYGSLITMGLRASQAMDQTGPSDVDVYGSEPLAKRNTNTTIAVHEALIPADTGFVPPHQPEPGKAHISPTLNKLTVRQKWGYTDPEIIPPTPEASSKSDHTIVHKGFGRFTPDKESTLCGERLPFYPPLPNAAYHYLNNGGDSIAPPEFTPQLDGAAFVKDYILERNAHDEGLVKQAHNSLGELVAAEIDWDGTRLYHGGELGKSGPPGMSISLWRKDFVTAIDNAKAHGEEPFAFCNKCGERHIPWGPPIAMQDQDSCLSMLPGWFPAEMFDNPWEKFIKLINHTIMFEEREQGRTLDPSRAVWDMEFHEGTAEWRAVGRRGGWWKCRSGKGEGEENASIMERECKLCHRAKTKEEREKEAQRMKDAKEKVAIRIWIEEQMKAQMRKDKAFVEARIRYEAQQSRHCE